MELDRDDLLDLIETAIDDSMDIDWTSKVGAENVLRELEKAGVVRFQGVEYTVGDKEGEKDNG